MVILVNDTHIEAALTGQYPRPYPLFARSGPHIPPPENRLAEYPLTYSAMLHQTTYGHQIRWKYPPFLCMEATSRKELSSLCKQPRRGGFHEADEDHRPLSGPQWARKKPQA